MRDYLRLIDHKLRVEVKTAAFTDYTDYSGQQKSMELRSDLTRPGSRALVVDDWVETGAQVRAAISLVERCGGVVAGVAAIDIDAEAGADLLRRGYRCFTLSGT